MMSNPKKRYIFLVALFLISFLFGLFVGQNLGRQSKNSQQVTKDNSGDLDYIVNKDEIFFLYTIPQYSNSRTAGLLKYTDHPKLKEMLKAFGSDDYSSYLHVTPIKLSDDKDAVVISNMYPDHGDFGENYAMVYYPRDDKVLYETGGLFERGRFKGINISENGDVHLNFIFGYYEQCNSCGYMLDEFLVYDQKIGSYVTNNTFHKDVFKKDLETLESRDKCIANWDKSEELTYSAIKEKYGENHECQFRPGNSSNDKMTPKKFFIIKQALEDITNRKELPINSLNL